MSSLLSSICFILVVSSAVAIPQEYEVSVVAFTPIWIETSAAKTLTANMNRYSQIIPYVYDSDMIIFPEYGLTSNRILEIDNVYELALHSHVISPKMIYSNPCLSDALISPWVDVLKNLSCLALKSRAYVVANILELDEGQYDYDDDGEPISFGTHYYSTNVVFDANGIFIAKCRNSHGRGQLIEGDDNSAATSNNCVFRANFTKTPIDHILTFKIIFDQDVISTPIAQLDSSSSSNEKYEAYLVSGMFLNVDPFIKSISFYNAFASINKVNLFVGGYLNDDYYGTGIFLKNGSTHISYDQAILSLYIMCENDDDNTNDVNVPNNSREHHTFSGPITIWNTANNSNNNNNNDKVELDRHLYEASTLLKHPIFHNQEDYLIDFQPYFKRYIRTNVSINAQPSYCQIHTYLKPYVARNTPLLSIISTEVELDIPKNYSAVLCGLVISKTDMILMDDVEVEINIDATMILRRLVPLTVYGKFNFKQYLLRSINHLSGNLVRSLSTEAILNDVPFFGFIAILKNTFQETSSTTTASTMTMPTPTSSTSTTTIPTPTSSTTTKPTIQTTTTVLNTNSSVSYGDEKTYDDKEEDESADDDDDYDEDESEYDDDDDDDDYDEDENESYYAERENETSTSTTVPPTTTTTTTTKINISAAFPNSISGLSLHQPSQVSGVSSSASLLLYIFNIPILLIMYTIVY